MPKTISLNAETPDYIYYMRCISKIPKGSKTNCPAGKPSCTPGVYLHHLQTDLAQAGYRSQQRSEACAAHTTSRLVWFDIQWVFNIPWRKRRQILPFSIHGFLLVSWLKTIGMDMFYPVWPFALIGELKPAAPQKPFLANSRVCPPIASNDRTLLQKKRASTFT
jgi:hypothetical protein